MVTCLDPCGPSRPERRGVAGSALRVHFPLSSQQPWWWSAILPGLHTDGETEAGRGGVACAGSDGRSDTRPVQAHGPGSGWPRHSLRGVGQGGLPRRSRGCWGGAVPSPLGSRPGAQPGAGLCRAHVGTMWTLSPAAWPPGLPEQPGWAGRPNMAPGPCRLATGRAGAWPGLGRAGLPASSSAGR